MKRVLPIASIALGSALAFGACTAKPREIVDPNAQAQRLIDSIRMAADTAGLAEYQQWKAENELAPTEQYQNGFDAAPVAVAPAPRAVRRSSPARRTSTRSSAPSRSYDNGSMSSTSGNTARAPQKKGWSKAAKGAVIGAGAGAAAGAIINKKNRAVGAVVGGVLGGGVGFGVGRGMDKRDGRY